jgi:rRNA maturation protein Nop10
MTAYTPTGETLLSADDSLSNPGKNEYALRCPGCGEATGLHIDGVVVENAAGQRLQVDADGEDSNARLKVQLENDHAHSGRRHQMTLTGTCEHCGDFSLAFRQHKGTTFYSKPVAGS